MTAAIEAIPSLADDLKPPEYKVLLWVAVRAELLSRLARHDAAAELDGLRRLIAASDAPDRDAVANERRVETHRT